jgi:hypothetical protein
MTKPKLIGDSQSSPSESPDRFEGAAAGNSSHGTADAGAAPCRRIDNAIGQGDRTGVPLAGDAYAVYTATVAMVAAPMSRVLDGGGSRRSCLALI